MIRTTTDNIRFEYAYQLNLNCADMDPDLGATKTRSVIVQVSFSGDSSFTFENYPSTTAVSKSPTTVIQAQLTLLVAVSLHFEP